MPSTTSSSTAYNGGLGSIATIERILFSQRIALDLVERLGCTLKGGS